MLAQRGIGVAHCPSSNFRLASGICPVKGMVSAGVNVGLGAHFQAENSQAFSFSFWL